MPSDCELIVIDNQSVEPNVSTIAAEFPTVHIIEAGSNLGFGVGGNVASHQARGDYLAFLNPDTLVEPGWIEALIEPLKTSEKAALSTPQIVMTSIADTINTCGCDIHISGISTCRGLGKPRSAYPNEEPVASVSGAAFVIKKSVYEMLGGFDDAMFLYMEDIDLSWRARLAGLQTVYVPDSVVHHDYELKITRLKVFWQERNRYLMLLKSLRWATLLILSPAFIVAEVVTAGFVLLRDRQNATNKIKAVKWIFSNWRLVLQKRRATQSLRKVTDRELLRDTGYRLEFTQAASGLLPRLASLVFDPIFFTLRALALALIWW